MTFAAFVVVPPKLAQLRPNLSNYSMIAVDFAAPAADDGDDASLDLCSTNKVKDKITINHHVQNSNDNGVRNSKIT